MPLSHGGLPHWQCLNSQALSVTHWQRQQNYKIWLICCCFVLSETGRHFFEEGKLHLSIGSSVPIIFIISCQNFMCNSIFRSEQKCLNTTGLSNCAFCLTHHTGLGSVAQRTLPHIASKPCMLKASEMLPAATVSHAVMLVLPVLQ